MKFIGIALLFLGLTRMLGFDLPYGPYELVAPKPLVFLNPNYFNKTKIIIAFMNGETLELDPIKDHQSLYSSNWISGYYPLMRIMDRPELIAKKTWDNYAKYFFCKARSSTIKKEILIKQVTKIIALKLNENNKWIKTQETICFHNPK